MLKGGWALERTVSLRSGERVQKTLRALGHRGRADRCWAGDVAPGDRGQARCGVHSAARRRRRGRHRAGTAGNDRHPLYRLGAGSVHALHRQGAGEASDARGGHPHPGLERLQGERGQRARCRGGAAVYRAEARVSDSRQARPPRLGAGREVRALERGAAARDRGRVLIRPQGRARALHQGPRPGGVGAGRGDGRPADGPGGSRSRCPCRGDPAGDGVLQLRVALRDRHDDLRLPGRAADRSGRARAGACASRRTSCSAATASRVST